MAKIMKWLAGTIVSGYGVASGRAADCPFQGGSIRLQQPLFKASGIDLSGYFAGTLNVDLTPHTPPRSSVVFDGRLRWHGDLEEHFILSEVEFEAQGQRYRGLWYYPDPETKIDHFQRESVVELLLPWIDGLHAGEIVKIGFCDRKSE